ncbi:hypothetical protein MSG28_007820 [Choristoneura fumiferana]|uniref:Uncharacterized protein n=1 Tax=Choristoneura fumiferana TaxID=7141 RepID=A0ACC0JZA4_CHOFU|nr:hypothetical protein MSG28_007820 [Choristoneura fumiferana]
MDEGFFSETANYSYPWGVDARSLVWELERRMWDRGVTPVPGRTWSSGSRWPSLAIQRGIATGVMVPSLNCVVPYGFVGRTAGAGAECAGFLRRTGCARAASDTPSTEHVCSVFAFVNVNTSIWRGGRAGGAGRARGRAAGRRRGRHAARARGMAVSCPEVMYGAYYPYLYGRGAARSFHHAPHFQYDRKFLQSKYLVGRCASAAAGFLGAECGGGAPRMRAPAVRYDEMRAFMTRS